MTKCDRFRDCKVRQNWITNCDKIWITKYDKSFKNWITKSDGITKHDGLQSDTIQQSDQEKQ